MTTEFDFMTSDEFRDVLEADRKEMQICLKSQAWKAVHVLAGSIVEAVLADYLIGEGYTTSNSVRRANLAKIINILTEKNAISTTLADLCSVIKNYRNLVHPGRSIRTEETVDKDTARVAVSLVEMILKEVREKKRAKYGYTAEQLVSKIRSDPSAKSILMHLLKDMHNREKERLLLDVLPNEYIESLEEFDPDPSLIHLSDVLPVIFRMTLTSVSEDIRKKVANRFVKILKESPGYYVSHYELAFFKFTEVEYLTMEDAQLVKDHFADQLNSQSPDVQLFDCISGIGCHISQHEFRQFINPLIRFCCQKENQNVQRAARTRLSLEYSSSGKKFQESLMNAIDSWIDYFNSIGQPIRAQEFNSLKEDIDIPF